MSFVPGYNYSVGVGYIAIPVDIDRDKYIGLCYKTNTVSILCDDGSFFNRIPIPSSILGFIDFPKNVRDFGTAVLYVNEPIKNQLFIVSLVESPIEIGDMTENQFKWKRKWGNNLVEISGSGKEKYVSITVDGEEGESNFIVSVKNKSKTGKVLIETDGEIKLSTNQKLSLETFKEFIVSTLSKNEILALYKQSEEEHYFEGKKFRINKGDEAMLKGNKTKDFLEELLTTISKITVTTSLGVMPIMNLQDFILLKEKLKLLLSEKSFLE